MKQAPTYPGVSVLTVTRRCDALQRCLDSVADDQPQVHHLKRRKIYEDLGEWLFPRPLLVAHPFESSYSTDDWERIIVEDAKLSRIITTSGAALTA